MDCGRIADWHIFTYAMKLYRSTLFGQMEKIYDDDQKFVKTTFNKQFNILMTL